MTGEDARTVIETLQAKCFRLECENYELKMQAERDAKVHADLVKAMDIIINRVESTTERLLRDGLIP